MDPKQSVKIILGVILVLSVGMALGVAGYLAKNKTIGIPQPTQTPALSPTPTPDEAANWKIYRNEEYGFEFKYPADIVKISQKDGYINLLHSIPFVHEDSCDFKDGASSLKELTDFNISVAIENLGIFDTIRAKEGEAISQYIVGDMLKISEGYIEEFQIARLKGYRIINSFEGCGNENYYFSGGDNRSLFIKRKDVAELILNPQRYLSVEGVIAPQQADVLLNQILSTFKFIEKNSSFSCGTAIVADIDNNIYNTVQIGSQCWLKQNLRVTKNPAGKTVTRYCYNNDSKICDTDGGLYDWDTAMNGSIGCNGTSASQPKCSPVVQGICPMGWHMPSHYEWTLLEKNVGSAPNVFPYDEATRDLLGINEGTNLKTSGYSGFEGVLAGYRSTDGLFFLRGAYAYFWSSTESGTIVWFRPLGSSYATVYRNSDDKAGGFSVRCLKD